MRVLKNNSGFTLTELITVSAVVGLLAGISVPQMNKWVLRHQVRGAAMELASDMMLARSSALTEKNQFFVCLDAARNAYALIDDNSSDGIDGNDCLTAAGDDSITKSVSLPDNTEIGYAEGAMGTPARAVASLASDNDARDGISFPGNSAQFNPNGTALAGFVYVKNDLDDTYAVGVPVPATGNIQTWRLQSGSTNSWKR